MFNLLVNIGPWPATRSTFIASRVFQFTSPELTRRFFTEDGLSVEAVTQLPTLFMSEGTDARQNARVGTITRVQLEGSKYQLTYVFDELVPPIPNSRVHELRVELGIEAGEFGTTHWAIKDVDLYREVLRLQSPGVAQPTVFAHRNVPVDQTLVSVMMPFAGMGSVYEAIQAAAQQAGMRCQRADEVWNNPSIIQDVYDLIRSARVVVCDLTGKNANVFYETGISHALNKDVILITQSAADVPFDIGHLRHIRYLDNGEGRADLTRQIAAQLINLTRP
jgi:hypothetical protein